MKLQTCMGVVLALVATTLPATAAPPAKEPDPALQRRIDEALSKQGDMIAAAVSELTPERPSTRDVYFIGVAGWGDQDVFRKEVRAVRSLFERSFGAADRALSLVNHAETLKVAPLATNDTIEATLAAVAGVMDPDEDLLVMFLTSHGEQWDGFNLLLNGAELGRLKTAQFARMLGATRIRNRVIIVSSCFSGQFVPALAEENTLLITAAASDRASFGCTSTADWTYFGEAFFKVALPKHKKFAPAFEEARKRIEDREKREGFTPSVPQIRVGERIRKVLDEMGL
ncbi:MAG: C13 family peptidase [Rhizobiaceae bacterium]